LPVWLGPCKPSRSSPLDRTSCGSFAGERWQADHRLVPQQAAQLVATAAAAASKRTRTAADGDMHEPEASSRNSESDGTRTGNWLVSTTTTVPMYQCRPGDPSGGLGDAGGCDDGSALRCSRSHDLTGPLRSEGKKCPAHLKRGQIDPVHIKPRPNQRHCAVCPSVLTLVTAITSTLLRHGRLRAERNEPPWYPSRKPKVPPVS
jgi:hypothetical protein